MINLKILAVFWSMSAPVELPSLPGIGMLPTHPGSIHIPTMMWESEELEKCKIEPTPPEKLAEPLTPIGPKPVSKSPDLGQTPWNPLLGDSVHAYAWWMLSSEEFQIILEDTQKDAAAKATSRMTGSSPKQQTAIKKNKAEPSVHPKGTTPKTGSGGSNTPPKTPVNPSPLAEQGIPVKQELVQARQPTGPPSPKLQTGAGVREQSTPRGTAGRSGYTLVNPLFSCGRAIGQGTPSVAPVFVDAHFGLGTKKRLQTSHQKLHQILHCKTGICHL